MWLCAGENGESCPITVTCTQIGQLNKQNRGLLLVAIPVAVMCRVAVTIVQVVHVVAMGNSDVPAAFAMDVGVLVMDGVEHGFSLKVGNSHSIFSSCQRW